MELTKAIVQEMGLDIEIRLGPWAKIVRGLEDGEIDIIQGMYFSPERDLKFDFSDRHLMSSFVTVVRKGTGGPPTSVGELGGRRIVMRYGGIEQDFMVRNGLGDRIAGVETEEDVLRAVAEGKYDCGLTTRGSALYLIEKHGWKNLSLAARAVFSEEYAYAALKGQKALLSSFNEGLRFVRAKDAYRGIREKWMGGYEDSPLDLLSILRYVALVAIPTLTLVLAFFLWSWSLRKQVARRTEELRKSEEHFRSLVEGAPDAIFLQTQSRFSYLNEAACRLFGAKSPEQLLGRFVMDRFHPSVHEIAAARIRRLNEEKKAVPTIEQTWLRLDGTEVPVDVSAVPITYKGQNGSLVFAHDMTERKKIERSVSLQARRAQALLKLPRAAERLDEAAFMQYGQELAEHLTESEIAFVHFVNDDQETLELTAWSSGTLEHYCRAAYESHYPITQAGIWADALRREAAVVFNDYPSTSNRRGLPEGHAELKRLISAPVIEGGRVRLLVGVGNKTADYTETDVETVKLIANEMWRVVRQCRADKTLREAEQHFRNLADSGSALIWTSAINMKCDYFNQPWLTFTGKTLEQAKGDGWVESVYPEDFPHCHETYVNAFDRRERFSMLYRMRRHDGVYRWVQDDGGPRYDSEGRFLGHIGYCLDVTEFKLAQKRIEHLNNVLRAIRDVNQLIVHERDRHVMICEASRQMVENRGYASALLILTDGDDRLVSWAEAGMGSAFEPVEAMLERGELPSCCKGIRDIRGVVLIEDRATVCHECPLAGPCAASDTLCVRLVHGDTAFGYFAVATEPQVSVDFEERSLLAEVAADLAYALNSIKVEEASTKAEKAREFLQRQLLQAQKMESIGRLAGGIAHDYNNMLAVILGYAELALNRVDASDTLHGDLQEIIAAAKRSRDITRQLLAFARKQDVQPEAFDLNRAVEETRKMLQHLVGEDVSLTWLPQPRPLPVEIDRGQLTQVLVNLCTNARDSIGNTGRIAIETAAATIDGDYCAKHPGFMPGDFVLLMVCDDGCGMNEKTLASIFEPFFTTKDSALHSGLGLAVVFGIVTQNKGFINVHSEPGRGPASRYTCLCTRVRQPRNETKAHRNCLRMTAKPYCWSKTRSPCSG